MCLSSQQLARFWGRVRFSGWCWEWTGAITSHGYGNVSLNGVWHAAHRVTYALEYGSIPEGMHLDHLCRNRRCVRPHHLEAVTPRENTVRGFAARRTGR